jgi:receptor expression-enhancing protein 5/6
VIVVALFFVFEDIMSRIIVDMVGVLYPAYISFKAIETPHLDDDKQWLTYWVVFFSMRG